MSIEIQNFAVVENAEKFPTSLNTRASGPKGPRKFEWMLNLHGVLHGMHWIMFYGIPDFFVKEVRLSQSR